MYYIILTLLYKWKESGLIRRRFGRIVGITKAENYKRFMRGFECYWFSSILDYRKNCKILPTCILFLQKYDSE